MPRTANTDQPLQPMGDTQNAPDFQEEPAPPPSDAKSKLAQARKDLAAQQEAKPDEGEAKPDETIPGGVYIVAGQLVDAWGEPIDEDAV